MPRPDLTRLFLAATGGAALMAAASLEPRWPSLKLAVATPSFQMSVTL